MSIQRELKHFRAWLVVAPLAVFVSLTNCTPVDQEKMQAEYLDGKIEEFRDFQHRNCIKKVYKEAKMKADSFFLQLAKQQSYDTMRSPRNIPRPLKPTVTIREDSVELGPLVGKNKHGAVDSIPVPKKVLADSIE